MSNEETKLTGKQKRFLRSLANRLEARLVIGHGGVSDNCKKNLDTYLNEDELLKIRLKAASGLDRHEAAELFVNESASQLVQIFGSTIVLYRRNEEMPKIKLP